VEGTIRPVIAARLLGLSEKTVRAWADAGVLVVARRSRRRLLDVRSVHAVGHLVSELWAAGQDRDRLDQVWRHLEDSALLDREDLRESLERYPARVRGIALAPTRTWRRRDGATGTQSGSSLGARHPVDLSGSWLPRTSGPLTCRASLRS
jgi:hypothetical protein